ncbi:MAG: hypothetical protein M1831_001174 [Alyxoria varia]|nr:MAG: hypothetical protein M1831_001174 [Alyxoria varia]
MDSEIVPVDGGDVLFEKGPRSLRTQMPNGTLGLRLFEKLDLIRDLLPTSRTSAAANNRFVYYPDRLVAMPRATGMINNIRTVLTEPVFEKAISGAFGEFIRPPRPVDTTDESVGSFISRRFNKNIANNLVSAIYHGIYAGDIWQLSTRSILAGPWATEAKHKSLIAGAWSNSVRREQWQFYDDIELQSKLAQTGWSPETMEKLKMCSVFTFKRGLTQITEKLEKYLRSLSNVRIKKSTEVTSLENLGLKDDILIHSRDETQTESAETFSQVISTLSSPTTANLLPTLTQDSPPSFYIGVAALKHTSAVTVAVVNFYFRTPELLKSLRPPNTDARFLKPNGLEGFGYLIPRSIPFSQNPECALGVVFDSDITPDIYASVPKSQLGTRLTVMIGGHWWDDRPSLPSEDDCVAMAKSVLQRHLGIEEKPEAVRATIQKDCIPQYTVGHSERMALAHKGLKESFGGRLRVAGSWYTGVGVNDCFRAAHDVVKGLRRRGERTGLEVFQEGKPMVKVKKGLEGVYHIIEMEEGVKGLEWMRGQSSGGGASNEADRKGVMAAPESGNLIDFDIIETSKENIQALPSGRSAKSLAKVLSPVPSHSDTQDVNNAKRQQFESELASSSESDDPLDIYDRYVKWTLDAYPTNQSTPASGLLPLLERATQTFLDNEHIHYRNDARYLRLWLQYIHLFADAPRETFAFLARKGVGSELALFYEEFAAWLETHGRFNQAREVFDLGIEKNARPSERLMRKYGEFEKRSESRPQNNDGPSSPALPTIRPALAAKIDPLAASTSPEEQDPQAAARRAAMGGVANSNARRRKLEIFSDDGVDAERPSSGVDASKGWEKIGSLAERKKENVVGAKPWVGETLTSGKNPTASGMPKMTIFKDEVSLIKTQTPFFLIVHTNCRTNYEFVDYDDYVNYQSTLRMQQKISVPDHPSHDQKVKNPRNGRLECVAVNLAAVYPDPKNPSVEFCFEELRAAKRGWLQVDWRRGADEQRGSYSQSEQGERHPSPSRQHTKQQQGPHAAALTERPNPKAPNSPQKQHVVDDGVITNYKKQTLPLNDENDENAPPGGHAATPQKSEKDLARKIRREEKANQTRKISVREVKAETQTNAEANEKIQVQTNLDSPRRPKLRKKRSGEATMTVHTKAATDEIYEIFNQPLKEEDTIQGVDSEDEDETEVVDEDEYTSAGESTGTGRISATTSEFDDETQGDVTQGDVTESKSLVDGDDDDEEDDEGEEVTSGNNSGWTTFDSKKDVPGRDNVDHVEVTESTIHSTVSSAVESDPGDEEDQHDEQQVEPSQQGGSQHLPDEEVETPTSPMSFIEHRSTTYVPLPPEDIDVPTRPYRDPEQVAQSRLPFMTPIAEKTESSLGAATGRQHRQDDTLAKTPCPKGASKFDDREDGEPLSSPFQDSFVGINEQSAPLAGSQSNRVLQPEVVKIASTAKSQAESEESWIPALPTRPASEKQTRENITKSPTIKDRTCNPMHPLIRETILREAQPAISTFKGYVERKDHECNRRQELRKYCKSGANLKSSRGPSDKTHTLQLPPVLDLEDADCKYAVKRELGAGAFAPVYLVEKIVDGNDDGEEDSSKDQHDDPLDPIKSSKQTPQADLSALKLDSDPPTSWEFYILRVAQSRLTTSNFPLHTRSSTSIINAHSLHLYRDESYLLEEYRSQGTLLDLVNLCSREQHALSGTTGGPCGMDEALAMFFTVELLRTVESLHAVGVVHGDLKADNVLVRFDSSNDSDPANGGGSSSASSHAQSLPPYQANGAGGWTSKGVCLIDFGRGIDMRSFRPDVQFVADWETGPQDCAEMREMRPWTFQVDYWGLAGTVFVLLFGRYMEVVAVSGSAASTGGGGGVVEDGEGMGLGLARGKTWKLKEPLKRYWQTEIWGELFHLLLNSARGATAGEENGKLPALKGLRDVRKKMEEWLERFGERGVGLRKWVRRCEGLVGGGGGGGGGAGSSRR